MEFPLHHEELKNCAFQMCVLLNWYERVMIEWCSIEIKRVKKTKRLKREEKNIITCTAGKHYSNIIVITLAS